MWVFLGRIMNDNIHRLHETYLRLSYGEKLFSYEKLLEQNKSVTLHNRNVHILATEIFRVYRNTSLLVFSKIFTDVIWIMIYESMQCQT